MTSPYGIFPFGPFDPRYGQYRNEGGVFYPPAPTRVESAEEVRDIVAAALRPGQGVQIVVDDNGDTITISATGGGGGGSSYTDEQVRDVIGAALRGAGGATVEVDDAGDTITIRSKNRLADLTDVTMSGATVGKVVAVAAIDGQGNVTSWNLISPASGGGGFTDEQAQDAAAALLVAGQHTNITATYNDAANRIDLAISGVLDDAVIPAGVTRDSELSAAITAAVLDLRAGAPGQLDTLDELAAALGDDANFATTITSALGARLRVDAAQTLTAGQRQQGRENLGLHAVAASGSYGDLSGRPTIPDSADDVGATRVIVDGTYQSSYELDTSPVAPGELSPPAYSRAEVDGLIAGAGSGGGGWPLAVVAPASSTDFTTTAYTYLTGLQVTLTVGGTSEAYSLIANVDLAGYAANTATMVVVLEADAPTTGASTTFPVKIPVNGLRLPVVCQWKVSGMTAGTHLMKIAAYLTGTGNYQAGTGSILTAQRTA